MKLPTRRLNSIPASAGVSAHAIAAASPSRASAELGDAAVRWIGIPAFGIVIPNLTGLFGPLGAADALYWLGYAYFIVLSFLIWQGNRYFLLKQRVHYDWFNQPARKVMVLLAANVLYTAPLTIGWLWVWYGASDFSEADGDVILTVTLMNVICVIFITHIYETVYLIKQREDDLLRVERTDRARAEAELEALKNQIDPHFMFNSLNTLAHLIDTRPSQARAFCDDLADVYRYILQHKSSGLVLLSDELHFAGSYLALMERRFGCALDVRLPADAEANEALIPPISLQVLLENAVKHNAFSEADPLRVSITVEEGRIVVENERRPRSQDRPSPRVGLRNLNERFELLTRRPIDVSNGDDVFRVSLPLTGAA